MKTLTRFCILTVLLLAGLSKVSMQAAAPAGIAPTTYDWVEISGVGEAVTLSGWGGDDDEGQAAAALPWDFPWFGGSYTTLYIDPNGNVGFDNWLGITFKGDNRIPSAETPNNRIAAFYDDMAGPHDGACIDTGAVYTYDDTANERFIVEYSAWCSWSDGLLNTFEVLLYRDGRVAVQYQSAPSAPPRLALGLFPGESPVGVEGPGGNAGEARSEAVSDASAWMFFPGAGAGGHTVYLPILTR